MARSVAHGVLYGAGSVQTTRKSTMLDLSMTMPSMENGNMLANAVEVCPISPAVARECGRGAWVVSGDGYVRTLIRARTYAYVQRCMMRLLIRAIYPNL